MIDRHTRALDRREFLRAVRALSARYVERRAALPRRSPTDSAGKRAAFAGFFAPMHLLTVREIVRALGAARTPLDEIVDLGCGTGAASAGWALELPAPPALLGIDQEAWSLDEARWTWKTLGLEGRTRRTDLVRAATGLANAPVGTRSTRGLVLGWSVNELPPASRARLLPLLLGLTGRGWALLVVEPLARSAVPWWEEWAAALTQAGGRDDRWKFDARLPPPLAALDEAAGFERETLNARSLYVAAGSPLGTPIRR